jgi:peptidoglycan hydrolase-like amidase
VIPAEMIATFASASFLADKYAASTKLFCELRNFASKKAQEKLTIKAPDPTAVNEIASGVDGLLIS